MGVVLEERGFCVERGKVLKCGNWNPTENPNKINRAHGGGQRHQEKKTRETFLQKKGRKKRKWAES